jgi:hypothetical protein
MVVDDRRLIVEDERARQAVPVGQRAGEADEEYAPPETARYDRRRR